MLFYFVRHGETEANRQKFLAGSGIDHPLNEVGHRQALELALRLRRAVGPDVSRIVASNLTRARQTGEYLAKELGLSLEIQSGWQEWNLGEWEGKSFAEFEHLLLHGEPSQGESRQDFYRRVEMSWKQTHRDDRPYIVVSHGGVWLALQDLLGIERFRIRNCDLIKIMSTGNRFAWTAERVDLTPFD